MFRFNSLVTSYLGDPRKCGYFLPHGQCEPITRRQCVAELRQDVDIARSFVYHVAISFSKKEILMKILFGNTRNLINDPLKWLALQQQAYWELDGVPLKLQHLICSFLSMDDLYTLTPKSRDPITEWAEFGSGKSNYQWWQLLGEKIGFWTLIDKLVFAKDIFTSYEICDVISSLVYDINFRKNRQIEFLCGDLDRLGSNVLAHMTTFLDEQTLLSALVVNWSWCNVLFATNYTKKCGLFDCCFINDQRALKWDERSNFYMYRFARILIVTIAEWIDVEIEFDQTNLRAVDTTRQILRDGGAMCPALKIYRQRQDSDLSSRSVLQKWTRFAQLKEDRGLHYLFIVRGDVPHLAEPIRCKNLIVRNAMLNIQNFTKIAQNRRILNVIIEGCTFKSLAAHPIALFAPKCDNEKTLMLLSVGNHLSPLQSITAYFWLMLEYSTIYISGEWNYSLENVFLQVNILFNTTLLPGLKKMHIKLQINYEENRDDVRALDRMIVMVSYWYSMNNYRIKTAKQWQACTVSLVSRFCTLFLNLKESRCDITSKMSEFKRNVILGAKTRVKLAVPVEYSSTWPKLF